MLDRQELLKQRKVSSNNYDCPIHLSVDNIEKLFTEAGLDADTMAVGRMGDVLENFALAILRDAGPGKLGRSDIEDLLARMVP